MSDSVKSQADRRVIVSMVINKNTKGNNDDDKEKGRKAKKKRTAWVMGTSLLSTMYGLILVLCGVIFSAAEALQDNWLNSNYMGIFLVYIYVVATAFLVYLQAYVIPASRRKTNRMIEEQIRENKENNTENRARHSSGGSITNGVTPQMNGHPPLVSYSRQNSMTKGSITGLGITRQTSNTESVNGVEGGLRRSDSISDDGHEDSHAWVNLDGLKEMFEHEGSSFYLRLGALIFGLGNLIYIGLEVDYNLINKPAGCETGNYGWTYVFRLIFIVLQTFFIFKNSKIDITVHMNIARWGFMHVIATNLVVWIKTLVNEILQHIQHHSHDDHHDDHYDANETVSGYGYANKSDSGYVDSYAADYSYANCSDERGLLNVASPYLFPFVLEYSLIATGIFAIMTTELTHSNENLIMNNLHHIFKSHENTTKDKSKEKADMDDDEDDDTDSLNYAGPMHTHPPHHISLKSSHKGLFLGVLILAGILVSMVLFLYDSNSDDHSHAQLNYLITDFCLHMLISIANIMALYSLSKLPLSLKPFSVDDILLLISMAGSVMFEVSIIVSTAVYLSGGLVTGDQKTYTILALCCSVLASCQSVIQTVLVMSGLRRYSTPSHGGNPGREAVTFLIVTNVTAWIFRTVQVKELELGIQEDFYGSLAWLFILNLNLPLLLFFRFHSSVCFADIWHAAYTPVDHSKAIHKPMARRSSSVESQNSVFDETISGKENPCFFVTDSEEKNGNVAKL